MDLQISKTQRKYDGKVLTLNISKSTIQMQNDKCNIIDFPMPIYDFH
jgi:hypothetical protein